MFRFNERQQRNSKEEKIVVELLAFAVRPE